MPKFDFPGVYREEILAQRRVVQDTSTANLALVGYFEKGPVEEPVLVTDIGQATDLFGGFNSKSIAMHTLAAYYANGGQNAYLVRVLGAGSAQADAAFADEQRNVDSGELSTGGGAPDALSFTVGETPIIPGTFRLFLHENSDVVADVLDSGDGSATTFAGNVANVPVEPGTFAPTDGTETFTDDASGTLTGSGGGTGTIDYSTGAYSVTFNAAPAAVADNIVANYSHAVASGNATVAATPRTETFASQRLNQRVYFGALDNVWPVWWTIEFRWNSGATAKTATVNSSGVIGGDATGEVDLKTGKVRLDVGADAVDDGETIVAEYWYSDPLEAVDDGSGVLTTAGGLLASPGTIDYETGAVTGSTVNLDDSGGTFWLDYDQAIHPSQGRNAGELGNQLRLDIEVDENYLDAATGQYSRFFVSIIEEDASSGGEVDRGSFENVNLTDLTNSRHISKILNDAFLGSDLVEMVSDFSAEVPSSLQGEALSGLKVDAGTGVKREISTVLDVGRGIVPGTVEITYTSSGIVKTITDNAQGALAGDIDGASSAVVDYRTGVMVVTPATAPDAATDVTASFTRLSPLAKVRAVFGNGSDGAAVTRDDVTNYGLLAATEKGIYALDAVSDTLILSVPDFAGDWVAESAQLTYAESESRRDSIVMVAPPEGASVAQAIDYKRQVLASNSNRGAMYFPWILMEDPLTGNTVTVPPHGHVAGVWSRTDANRNIGKAPAGTVDGALAYLLGFEKTLRRASVGLLNNANVNALWQPEGQPRCVWGARTLETGGEFRYINKRRTVDFISVSIARSLWWTVFEDIGSGLFGRIQSQIDGFLDRQFSKGVLAGDSKEQAFFVKVDFKNNPKEVTESGQVIVDYGVATKTPNEFLRLRHRQLVG